MKNDLIQQFEFELQKNIIEMDKIRNFPRLQQLFDNYGYLEGAKMLIKRDETIGLTELILVNREDISIESLALNDKFQSLFTEDELEKCKRKLKRRN